MSSTGEKPTKKRYCLWTLTLLLAILGLCNLFLNITVIAVLRISQGMEAIEVIPDESLVKFYGRADLDKVIPIFRIECPSLPIKASVKNALLIAFLKIFFF